MKLITACLFLLITSFVITEVPGLVRTETVTVEKKNKKNKKEKKNQNNQKSQNQTEKKNPEKEEAQETEAKPEAVEYHFRSQKLLDQHFEKHGSEFDDYQTAQEYEKGASAVVNNPDALHKTEAEDGDDVYYLEKTNEFVIVSGDGYLRTYFKPSAGINYYNRQ